MSSLDKSTATFSDYTRSDRFQESIKGFANTLFESLRGKVDLDNPKHKEILLKWENRINATNVLDPGICNGLISDIASLVESKDPEAARKFKETSTAAIYEVSDAIKNDEVKEEDMWKYKALQIMAIATPLGLFTAFNYLDFAANVFGPMFGEAGLASGIAEAGTRIPILGKLFEAIRGDDAIRIVLEKTPILSDLLEVASDAIALDLVQDIGGEIVPVGLGSPILMGGIAAALVVGKAPSDIDRFGEKEKVENIQQKTQNKMEAAVEKVDSLVKAAEEKNKNRTPVPSPDSTSVSNLENGQELPIKQPNQTHAQSVKQRQLIPTPQSVGVPAA